MTATLLEPTDLLDMPECDHYELIEGRPVEKTMGSKASKVNVGLAAMIYNFVRLHGLGHVFDSEGGYTCFPGKTCRKPDVSFVSRGRLPNEEVPDGYLTIPPDLAVEVVSPNDRYQDIDEKVAHYRAAGVRLIWVVRPATKSILVHRLDNSTSEIPSGGILSGEDVLPGFTCQIAQLFD